MRSIARFAHVLGFVLLLGSILTFLVASSVGAQGGVLELAVARRVISHGSSCLTLPGLVLLIVSGSALVLQDSDLLSQGWVRLMVLATGGLVANGLLVVLPAVRSATELAQASLAAGGLVAGYRQAFIRESAAGNVNIVLALVAMAAGIWGTGRQRVALTSARPPNP